MEIYIASHGNFSIGCVDTLAMIIGKELTEDIKTYSLKPGENPIDYVKKFQTTIDMDTDYVIFTDILGGSVFNAFSEISHYNNIHVISGTNIPLILDFILSPEKDLKVRLNNSLENAKAGIKINHIFEKVTKDAEEF